MSFWLSLSSAMLHTSFAGECPSWSAFFGRYEGFSTRCAYRQTPHPVRDATVYFVELRNGEVRRIPRPRAPVNGGNGTLIAAPLGQDGLRRAVRGTTVDEV